MKLKLKLGLLPVLVASLQAMHALSLSITLAPSSEVFDLCQVCAPALATAAAAAATRLAATSPSTWQANQSAPLTSPASLTLSASAPAEDIPDKCKLSDYAEIVQTKCGIGKENPVHVLAGSYLGLVITFPEKQMTPYVAILLNNTLSNGTLSATNLADYRNDSSHPLEGIFNPADRSSDRSRVPRYIYTFLIPTNLDPSIVAVKSNGDGTTNPSVIPVESPARPFFQITYNSYSGPQKPSYIASYRIRNLTIDTDKSTWIAPHSSIPSPLPVAQGGKLADTAYAIIISGSVGVALIITIAGYMISRKRHASRLSRRFESRMDLYNHPLQQINERGVSSDHLRAKSGADIQGGGDGFSKATMYRKLTNNSSNSHEPLYDTDSDEENVAVVFKKNYNGSYAASVASKNSRGRTSSLNSSSHPRSILKTQRMVESEAINAQMYDPIIVTSYRPPSRNHEVDAAPAASGNGRSENGTPLSKRVVFKETVETVIVDLSMPPALDEVPTGLFDDSEDDMDRQEDEDDEDDDSDRLHFNDGGVEKDIRQLLRRKVEIEEDEYDSHTEDNDDWRKEPGTFDAS
ncbi:hypothetical protein CcCBS67573_g01667 [Chytriomyces confervae]|uniref:Mid2 domain-containing protein n=1 Tax=Chytriomyces confervae TaxID=246404 RepID=A0A507FPW4_9FUNG|nr:hypothetical protein HDU80_000865 [Chytriomyces hyalinus]TPX77077.1 hypothetical protein CcCBS67573_g01667 [Chytriomyces confervae]